MTSENLHSDELLHESGQGRTPPLSAVKQFVKEHSNIHRPGERPKPGPPESERSTISLWELACDLMDEFGHGL